MQSFSSHLLLIRQLPTCPPPPAQWHLEVDSPFCIFHIPFHLQLIGNLQSLCVSLSWFLSFYVPHFLCWSSSPSLFAPFSLLSQNERQTVNWPLRCLWFIWMQEGHWKTGGFIGTDDLRFMFLYVIITEPVSLCLLKHTDTQTLYFHLHFSFSLVRLTHTHTNRVEEGHCAIRVLVWGLVVEHLD